MTTQKWATPEAIATALDTQLNALANAAISTASAAFDNEADLYQYADLELVLASLTPTAPSYVLVYINVSLDGTNYEDLNASAVHSVLGIFPVSTGVGAKRVVLRNLLIPPLKFKLAAQNQTNVSFGGTLNTLKIRRHNESAV